MASRPRRPCVYDEMWGSMGVDLSSFFLEYQIDASYKRHGMVMVLLNVIWKGFLSVKWDDDRGQSILFGRFF